MHRPRVDMHAMNRAILRRRGMQFEPIRRLLVTVADEMHAMFSEVCCAVQLYSGRQIHVMHKIQHNIFLYYVG